MRIPKLRGFKNRLKIDYEIVNVGRIGELALLGAFEAGERPARKAKAKPAPITVNQEILRAVGLVRTLDQPMKVLGQGDLEVALFVVADAFSKSAVAKIEAAGGSVQVLEIPTRPLPALGVEADGGRPRPSLRRMPPATAGPARPLSQRPGRPAPARRRRPSRPRRRRQRARPRSRLRPSPRRRRNGRGRGRRPAGPRRPPPRPRPAPPPPASPRPQPKPARAKAARASKAATGAAASASDEPAAQPTEDTTSDDGPAGEDA